MFYNIDNLQVLFEEYRPNEDKLNSYRKRLLAIEPSLFIASEEVNCYEEDWNEVYFFIKDESNVICIIPNPNEINVPRIYVLSGDKDYKMNDDEMFSFLSLIYNMQIDIKLTDKTFICGEDITGLIFYIRYYLEHKDVEPEPEIVNHYDNYNTGERKRYYDTPEVDREEALRLVKLILATVYNYRGEYKFSEQDIELLS